MSCTSWYSGPLDQFWVSNHLFCGLKQEQWNWSCFSRLGILNINLIRTSFKKIWPKWTQLQCRSILAMETVCVSSMKRFVATNTNTEDSVRKLLFNIDWPYLKRLKGPRLNTPIEVNDVALTPEEMFLFWKMPASLIPSSCYRNEIWIHFIIVTSITSGHIKFPPVLFGEMWVAQCASG